MQQFSCFQPLLQQPLLDYLIDKVMLDRQNNLEVDMSQDFLPRLISLEDKQCAIGLRPNIIAPVPLPLQVSTESEAVNPQGGYISISGNITR